MCGIAGFYGFRNDSLLHKFSNELKHRGPDGEGFFIDDQVSLLNRRLAIIDRVGGDQPIYNEDKTVVVSYNGEIYNFKELRLELEKKGHIFKTKSDTEVIVHGYEEWGGACFDRFNGMFALSLYDIKKKKMILARDHFGIKPLYFTIIPPDSARDFPPASARDKLRAVGNPSISVTCSDRLMFCSEIKPLIYSGLVKKKPNDKIIYRYLRYRVHDDQRETFFDGVYKLMPGEMMIVDNEELQINKYTNLEAELETSIASKVLTNEAVRKFKEKLIEATKLRLISEVPLGTCLSGGLDSSAIVSVVNKLLANNVAEASSVGKVQNTFSAVFPRESNDEEKFIDEVVEKIKNGHPVKSHKTYPKAEEFFWDLEEFLRTQEEPTISSGPYSQYKVMELAAKKVTVLLDGQGLDEMLAGYDPYFFVYLRQLYSQRKLFLLLKELIFSLDILFKYGWDKFMQFIGIKNKKDSKDLMDSGFVESQQDGDYTVVRDNLKKRLIDDIFKNSLPALLRYEDKNAMKFSLEGRVPYLDKNLIKLLFSLPCSAIIQKGWNKFILRQSVRGIIPESILARRNKIGFTTPEYQWFMRMKNRIYSIFLSESFARRPYFNQREVLKAFQQFLEEKIDDTLLFWRLINVEIWLRIFFDKTTAYNKTVNKRSRKKLPAFEPNEGKRLEIEVNNKKYIRFPLSTNLFQKGDKIAEKISQYVLNFFIHLRHFERSEKSSEQSERKHASLDSSVSRRDVGVLRNEGRGGWFIVVSEKIVAISQGRSYFIWEVKPSLIAKILSNYVTKTPYGIGLGSQWTMQLAIQEIGLARILLATVAAALTKPLGIRGLFYKIAGPEAASIDGPTEYSLYPSNVSAKLGPKEPERVGKEIHKAILNLRDSATQFLSHESLTPRKKKIRGPLESEKIAFASPLKNFLGAVIIDANDLGQKVLGNSTNLDSNLIEKIFSDNPMGQADEQTPLVLVFEKE